MVQADEPSGCAVCVNSTSYPTRPRRWQVESAGGVGARPAHVLAGRVARPAQPAGAARLEPVWQVRQCSLVGVRSVWAVSVAGLAVVDAAVLVRLVGLSRPAARRQQHGDGETPRRPRDAPAEQVPTVSPDADAAFVTSSLSRVSVLRPVAPRARVRLQRWGRGGRCVRRGPGLAAGDHTAGRVCISSVHLTLDRDERLLYRSVVAGARAGPLDLVVLVGLGDLEREGEVAVLVGLGAARARWSHA